MKLFKYRAVNEYSLDIIKNHRLYLPSVVQLNDPAEFRYEAAYIPDESLEYNGIKLPEITMSVSDENGHNEWVYDENYQNRIIVEGIKEIYDSLRKELRIYCFSEKNDNYLMWSFYGDYHKGFCIEFSDKVFDYVENKNYRKVNYNGIERNLLKLLEAGELSQECANDIRNTMEKILFCKGKMWEYEQEVRYIVSPSITPGIICDDPKYYLNFPIEAIKNIYFGADISDVNRKEVISCIDKYCPNVGLYDMKINYRTYELHTEKCKR